MTQAQDWDAVAYDRISDPQVAWARVVLERLELRGDETVLDAGCGSGRVTQLLLERLPRGRVIAIDAAPSMVDEASAALGERATVLQSDLVALTLAEPVDAVFSNAVFHWIADHDRLFERLLAVLRPGGRLVAQCGGEGNIDRLRRLAAEVASEQPFADALTDWSDPWNYASAEDARDRLASAGFTEVETWLEPSAVDPPEPREFLRTVCLRNHLAALPEHLRDEYLDTVADRYGDPTLDYVRLNIVARRPGPGHDR